jgi:hypothetical protein
VKLYIFYNKQEVKTNQHLVRNNFFYSLENPSASVYQNNYPNDFMLEETPIEPENQKKALHGLNLNDDEAAKLENVPKNSIQKLNDKNNHRTGLDNAFQDEPRSQNISLDNNTQEKTVVILYKHQTDDVFGNRLKNESDSVHKSSFFNHDLPDKKAVILINHSYGFNSSWVENDLVQSGKNQDGFSVEKRQPDAESHMVVLDGSQQVDQSPENQTTQQIFKPHVNIMKGKYNAGKNCFRVHEP